VRLARAAKPQRRRKGARRAAMKRHVLSTLLAGGCVQVQVRNQYDPDRCKFAAAGPTGESSRPGRVQGHSSSIRFAGANFAQTCVARRCELARFNELTGCFHYFLSPSAHTLSSPLPHPCALTLLPGSSAHSGRARRRWQHMPHGAGHGAHGAAHGPHGAGWLSACGPHTSGGRLPGPAARVQALGAT
jgi:hypothetical protein